MTTAGDNSHRIEVWPIDKIKPYPNNPRTIPEKAIAKVAGSLKEFGFQKPIVVDEAGVIIAGHVLLKAAHKAGILRVPVMVSNLDEKAARAYRIADNRTSQETDWLDDLLKIELLTIDDTGFDLSALGFDDDELARLLGEASNEAIANGTGSLADRFGIPPFSVLNAREGWWQERKRTWVALGIQSELGRGGGDKLTMSETVQRLKPSADQAAKRSGMARSQAAAGKPPSIEKAHLSSMIGPPADG